MIILTPRKNKDFYDYITGIYGIDERVIFDRRNFTSLKNLDSPLFDNEKRPEDRKKEFKKYGYDDLHHTWFKRPVGVFYKCLLEAGNYWYIFRVERYIDNFNKVYLDWEFVNRIIVDTNLHVGNTPVTFFEKVDYDRAEKPEYIKKYLKNGIPNPIVKAHCQRHNSHFIHRSRRCLPWNLFLYFIIKRKKLCRHKR